ncbi:MAG: division/cell wall cluster transcriptional repressor MraZ [Pyrinomonadaceae bacterium]
MLRGNYTATIDDKGRLKIPSNFRRRIEEKYGAEVFVTSLTGDSVWIYPLREWEAIEQRLATLPSLDMAKRSFLYRANYFGQQTEFDTQGRILIPAILRRKAEILGEVSVIGQLHFLEVWDAEKFQTHLENNPFTAEHEAALSRFI